MENQKNKKPKYSIVTRNGNKYYKIKRKVGKRQAATGAWVVYYKEFYGKTLKEATQKYEAYKQQQTLSNDLCFGELIDQWITDVFRIDGKYKDSTKELYVDAYRNNFAKSKLLGQKIIDIKGADIQHVYNNMTCNPSTIKQCHKLLRLFFQYCEREGFCQDVTRSLTLPEVNHKRNDQGIDVLTNKEVSNILKGFENHRLRLLIILALRTGARISELLALKYDDITNEGIIINKQLSRRKGEGFKIDKTKTASAVRVIPLSEETRKEIAKHKSWHSSEMLDNGYRTKYIFTTSTGGHYDRSSLRKSCDRVYEKAGVRSIGFHVYRHTFGSHLANSGVPIQTVAALMGHSDVGVTSKYYINVSSDAKQRAIDSIAL